jgi:hypothetical protein
MFRASASGLQARSAGAGTGVPGPGSPDLSPARQRPVELRLIGVVTLLAAVIIAWASLPLRPGGAARGVLYFAIVAAIGGAGQLALRGATVGNPYALSWWERPTHRLIPAIQAVPWAEFVTVAVLVLEVQHPSRPWHTGLLTVALLGYLVAVHLAESGATARLLRGQLPLMTAGFAVTVLAIGATALPGLAPGVLSDTLRAVAAAAAVIAGAIVIPTWMTRD